MIKTVFAIIGVLASFGSVILVMAWFANWMGADEKPFLEEEDPVCWKFGCGHKRSEHLRDALGCGNIECGCEKFSEIEECFFTLEEGRSSRGKETCTTSPYEATAPNKIWS